MIAAISFFIIIRAKHITYITYNVHKTRGKCQTSTTHPLSSTLFSIHPKNTPKKHEVNTPRLVSIPPSRHTFVSKTFI